MPVIEKEQYLEVVKNDGLALRSIPIEHRSSDICIAAVKDNGLALQYVPFEVITPEICSEICLAAVENNGISLAFVPNEFATSEVCLAAVTNNKDAITYVPAAINTAAFQEKISGAANDVDAVLNNMTENELDDLVQAFSEAYPDFDGNINDPEARAALVEFMQINDEEAALRADKLEHNDTIIEKKSLFSIEQGGEQRNYLNENNSMFDLLQICAMAERPYFELMQQGTALSESRFAEIQQSAAFDYSVDVNFDENTVRIYSVQGDVSEMDRNAANTSINTYSLDAIKEIVSEINDQTSDIDAKEQLLSARLDAINNSSKDSTRSESVKVNPEYYKELPKSERLITPEAKDIAEKIMNELDNIGVPYSAVERKDGIVAITVSKENEQAFRAAEEKATSELISGFEGYVFEQAARQIIQEQENSKDSTRNESVKVNPEYYKSLSKEERLITPEAKDVAEKVMKELDTLGVPYSAVERKDDVVAITVSKENEQAFRAAEEKATKEQVREFINPEYYKELDKADRFTQRMDEQTARDVVQQLDEKGIKHSAILDGNHSAVTISKNDKKAAPQHLFSRSKLSKLKQNTDKAKNEHTHDKEKNKSKNQGLE